MHADSPFLSPAVYWAEALTLGMSPKEKSQWQAKLIILLHPYLYLPFGAQIVIPQNDLPVFAPSGEQCPAPQLTEREHTAIVSLDVLADLVDTWAVGQ